MNLNSVRPGLRVRITRLGDTQGMRIQPKYLETRAVDLIGTIKSWVAGHSGEVWWVDHQNGTVGAYRYDEFEVV